MQENCGERTMIGRMLVEQGAVKGDDVELALRAQLESGKPLGEILVELGAICRPELERALAGQAGIELEEDDGLGWGLRERIERWHSLRGSVRPRSAN
jgi:hypothetical protein